MAETVCVLDNVFDSMQKKKKIFCSRLQQTMQM